MVYEQDLNSIALEIRRIALGLIYGARSGHPGGCLSAADLLACLYFEELRLHTKDAGWPGRDRFILSKGHACPALYAALHLKGYVSRRMLGSFRRTGGALQGEPDAATTPGVDATSGSLGQGFSIAMGMAYGLRLRGVDARVYCMAGDGELQEGVIWEGAMFAGHHQLDNLCVIVDYNKLQSDALNSEVLRLEPLLDKWKAFHWNTIETDGHSLTEVQKSFASARAARGAPTVILAHTVKGKGVAFMEGEPAWHGSLVLRDEEFAAAMTSLKVTAANYGKYAFHE